MKAVFHEMTRHNPEIKGSCESGGRTLFIQSIGRTGRLLISGLGGRPPAPPGRGVLGQDTKLKVAPDGQASILHGRGY